MQKSIIVTGVSGFIGGALAAAMTEKGYRVLGTVRRNPPRRFLGKPDLFEAVSCDLAEADEVRELFSRIPEDAPLTGIVHVAGLASDWGKEELFTRANFDATRNLLDEALKRNLAFFVNTSSLSVHGFSIKHRGSTEDGPYGKLITPYQRSKLAAEALVREAAQAGLPCLSLRPGNVYGPGDTTTLYPLLDAIAGGSMAYVKGGQSLTPAIHIDDMLRAYLLAIGTLTGAKKDTASGLSFNITTGEEITWKEFLAEASEAAGLRAPSLCVPAWIGYVGAAILSAAYCLAGSKKAPPLTRYRIQQVAHDYYFSIDRARDILGFNPQVSLSEGLARACAAWRQDRGGRQP